MRGLPYFNFPWFYAAEAVLKGMGHEVVNPCRIDEEMGVVRVRRDAEGGIVDVSLTADYDFDKVIARDLAAVEECDGIVMGPEWHRSEGARLEHQTAVLNDKKVFYGVDKVPFWDEVVTSAPSRQVEEPTPAERRQERLDQLIAEDGEVRVVDPETGGAKGSKPCQLFSAPPAGLEALGRVCGMGASKYELHNFRRGFKWSLSADAMLRHYLSWVGGEDLDPESGVSHLAHVAWHALVLIQFAQDHPDKDDRYKADT